MGKRISGKLLVGGLIIIAGVLALLFNIGVLPLAWKSIVLSWQMLLILEFGIRKVVKKSLK